MSRPTVRSGLAAVLAAVVADLALLAAGAAAGASFLVPQRGGSAADSATPPVEVGVGAVVLSTVLPLVVGLAVTALAARRLPRAVPVLRLLALVVTLGSLAAPLTLQTDAATRGLLALMHLVVGGAYLAATRPTAPVHRPDAVATAR